MLNTYIRVLEYLRSKWLPEKEWKTRLKSKNHLELWCFFKFLKQKDIWALSKLPLLNLIIWFKALRKLQDEAVKNYLPLKMLYCSIMIMSNNRGFNPAHEILKKSPPCIPIDNSRSPKLWVSDFQRLEMNSVLCSGACGACDGQGKGLMRNNCQFGCETH